VFDSVPADGQTWPERGRTIAAWLNMAVVAQRDLVAANGSFPAKGSLAWHDEHTLTTGSRLAAGGGWFARLTMGGAAELLRSLCVLYDRSGEVPLTRGHLPLVRSIQEHLGRVVWLCEPGAHVFGPEDHPAVPPEDDWSERRHRALLVAKEWAADRLSDLELAAADDDAIEKARDWLSTLKEEASQSAGAVDDRRETVPGVASFAAVVEEVSIKLYGVRGDLRPRRPYKRLSESAHGGLYGLHGDKAINEIGHYVFEPNTEELDGVASRVAAWWTTSMLLLGAYHGWEAEQALGLFTATWRHLYP
jgi:hypothetical protein